MLINCYSFFYIFVIIFGCIAIIITLFITVELFIYLIVNGSTFISRIAQTFQKRSELNGTSKIAQKIIKTILEKESNLCVAADVETADQLLALAEKVAPHICILKTHIDAISGVTDATLNNLKLLAKQYNFLIMEDR